MAQVYCWKGVGVAREEEMSDKFALYLNIILISPWSNGFDPIDQGLVMLLCSNHQR